MERSRRAATSPGQRKNFRNWVPITRPALIAMVQRRPAVARLDTGARDVLLADVGRLYDTSARVPDVAPAVPDIMLAG